MMNTEAHEIKHSTEYLFGPFRFIPARRTLLCNDVPQRVGGRAIDILAILLERPSEPVGKRELIARVWPTTVVEDGNLKVHMAALRRALGEFGPGSHYIVTVIGRGYCFVAPVQANTMPAPPPDAAAALEDALAAEASIAHVRTQIGALQSAVEVLEIERDHSRIELQSVRSQLEAAIRQLNADGAHPTPPHGAYP